MKGDRTMEWIRGYPPCHRRGFMARVLGLGGGGASILGCGARPRCPEERARVRVIWTYVPSDRPIWPHMGYDFERRKAQLGEFLTRACPEVDFRFSVANNAAQARAALQEPEPVDGFLVFMLGLWTRAPQAVGASGRPTLYVDDLYGGSGEFLIAYSTARRKGQKVVGVSSSNLEDVAAAARTFLELKKPGATAEDWLRVAARAVQDRFAPPGDLSCKDDAVRADPAGCLPRLKGKKLLVVGGGWGMPGSGKAIEEVLGIRVVPIRFEELHQAYEAADREESDRVAGRWMKEAERLVEPTPEEIRKSGAMYVGMKELLKRHGAEGISINCLGGFYGGKIKAYPCLGFSELNDAGLVGGCEGDLRSASTMMVLGALVGRPGFISDPVIDTSKNRIIYAHCVAPTKVFGPEGPRNPYHLRSHSEDRKGAALRSLLPLGHMTTTLEIKAETREVLIHQGKSVENVDQDMACRTKLAVEVKGDIDRLMREWDQWGWHRVTVYGDVLGAIREFAGAAGLKVVEEA